VAHHIIELDQQCSACGGTGVYIGQGERTGAAVVCNRCNGTGKSHFRHEYDDFEGRKWQGGVERVIEVNPGIVVGASDTLGLEDFGGMPYAEWYAGRSFPAGSEMRKYCCPAWWYQIADYEKKPHWDECICCGMFSKCTLFPHKDACWKRWDTEHPQPPAGGDCQPAPTL